MSMGSLVRAKMTRLFQLLEERYRIIAEYELNQNGKLKKNKCKFKEENYEKAKSEVKQIQDVIVERERSLKSNLGAVNSAFARSGNND